MAKPSQDGRDAVTRGMRRSAFVSTRAAATRQALLDAAARVFVQVGYHAASVADVVTEAGASVGALYHHFGGKADLWSELFDDYQTRHEQRAAEAVQVARKEGVTEPAALFEAGTRAYLLSCWTERSLSRLFHVGDGPPGFTVTMRRHHRAWMRQNGRLLHDQQRPSGDVLALVLTTVLSEAGHEVALQDDEAAAVALVDDVMVLVSRIVRG